MAAKTKLGRNPFSKKTAPAKTVQATTKKSSPRSSSTAPMRSMGVMDQFKRAVRFVSIQAPIGICFLTYRAFLLSFRSVARR